MKNSHILLLLLFSFLQQSKCAIGLDMSQAFNPLAYTCARASGYSFAVISTSLQNITDTILALNHSRAVGMSTDIMMPVCRSKSPISQVDQLFSLIPKELYNKIWVIVTQRDTGCSWNIYDSMSNCQYLSQLLIRIKYYEKQAGIYTSNYDWDQVFGSTKSCTTVSFAPLYYINMNNQTNFDGYNQIGGWTEPAMKLYYGSVLFCGLIAAKTYRP